LSHLQSQRDTPIVTDPCISPILAFLDESSKERFVGFIDLSRIGAFGVSLGGINVAELLRTDHRLKVALMMESPAPVSVVNADLVPPALWVTRDAAGIRADRARFGRWDESAKDLHQPSIDSAVSRAANSWRLSVNPLVHSDFTGAPYGSELLRRTDSGPGRSLLPQQNHESDLRLLTLQFVDDGFLECHFLLRELMTAIDSARLDFVSDAP
jgi:hypothetical protein